MWATANKKGFTIIEVFIVLGIAGVIVVIAFLAIPTLQRRQRNFSRKHDVDLLSTELENYKTNSGTYPFTAAGSASFISGAGSSIKHSLEFHNEGQAHGYLPPLDTITYQSAHWCNRYGDGNTPTDPIAGNDINMHRFAVWTQLETSNGSVSVYCVDNHP